MSENICVLNENGTVKGFEDRKKVHENGILHLTVQCWITNSKKEVLIQRRSKQKDQCPGKWDVSFGGHCTQIDAKDILISNLVKEATEEVGVQILSDDVIKLGEIRYTSQGGNNKELLAVFLYQVPDNQKFTFNDGEVSEVKWVSVEDLKQKILLNPDEYANRLPALTLLDFYLK